MQTLTCNLCGDIAHIGNIDHQLRQWKAGKAPDPHTCQRQFPMAVCSADPNHRFSLGHEYGTCPYCGGQLFEELVICGGTME